MLWVLVSASIWTISNPSLNNKSPFRNERGFTKVEFVFISILCYDACKELYIIFMERYELNPPQHIYVLAITLPLLYASRELYSTGLTDFIHNKWATYGILYLGIIVISLLFVTWHYGKYFLRKHLITKSNEQWAYKIGIINSLKEVPIKQRNGTTIFKYYFECTNPDSWRTYKSEFLPSKEWLDIKIGTQTRIYESNILPSLYYVDLNHIENEEGNHETIETQELREQAKSKLTINPSNKLIFVSLFWFFAIIFTPFLISYINLSLSWIHTIWTIRKIEAINEKCWKSHKDCTLYNLKISLDSILAKDPLWEDTNPTLYFIHYKNISWHNQPISLTKYSTWEQIEVLVNKNSLHEWIIFWEDARIVNPK